MASTGRASLATLSQGSYVTDAALAAVLKTLKSSPESFPEHLSRHTIKRARDEQVNVDTIHGPLIAYMPMKLKDSPDDRAVAYVNPAALLQHVCSESKFFGKIFKAAVDSLKPSPTAPLRICIYSDEITPGNAMKHDNKRKLQCVYWAVMDTGPLSLLDEDNWFLLTAVRSTVVNRLPGGMGQLMETMLGCFFKPGASFEDGLLVTTADGPLVVFAHVNTVLGDADALKMFFDVKGATGSMLCMLCRNITAHTHDLAIHDRRNFLIPSTCTDLTKIVPSTDQTIADAVALLKANVGGAPGHFKDMQQAIGIKYAPLGVLFSNRLTGRISLVSSVMYDWMHCYMCNGIFSTEVGLLLGKLAAADVSSTFIHNRVQAYTWPRRLSSRSATGKCMFQKRTGTLSSELKCSASEGLSMFRVLRDVLWTEVLPHADRPLVDAIRCYFALCKVIDVLLAIPRGGVDHNVLRQCILRHLDMYLAVYTSENWFPKCHYAIHLADHLQSKGLLLSCWTHERKHKQIKKFGNELDNTSNDFEKNVILNQLFCQLESLKKKPSLSVDSVHLVSPKTAPPKLATVVCQVIQQPVEILTSIEAVVGMSQRCFKGDVVRCSVDGSACVGEVWFHVSALDHCLSCVSIWENTGDHKYKVKERLILLPAVQIEHVCTYKRQADSVHIVPE